MIDPMTRRRIHIHSEAGLTQPHIARLTATSVSTVHRVLKEPPPTAADLASEQMQRPHAGRPALATAWSERVIALFVDRPDLPTTEVLRIASTEWGYSGSRATFFRLVRSLRPAPVPEPMVRFEGLPGEFAQFDFGQAVVTYADGRKEKVHIFVGRLKFSRQVQVMIVPNEQAETLIRCVVACCHAWGGSPLAWVFDNPTTVRLSKTGELPVRLHPYLQHLAGELRVAVELCAPRSGNQKGSVERGVGWAKNSFLLVRRFIDRAGEVPAPAPGHQAEATGALGRAFEQHRHPAGGSDVRVRLQRLGAGGDLRSPAAGHDRDGLGVGEAPAHGGHRRWGAGQSRQGRPTSLLSGEQPIRPFWFESVPAYRLPNPMIGCGCHRKRWTHRGCHDQP